MSQLITLMVSPVCFVFFAELPLNREIKLPKTFNQFQVVGGNFYFVPKIGNRIFELDSNLVVVNEYFLTGLPFLNINSFAVTPYSFFISDGDSIYHYHRRFGRIETFYRSKGILDFMANEEGDLTVIDQYGSRLVYLDHSGREKVHSTRYRARAICYYGRNFWLVEKKRILKLDEFGNEVTSFKIKGATRIAVRKDLCLALIDSGNKAALFVNEKLFEFSLQTPAIDVSVNSNKIYCLGANGNVLLEYFIDIK